MATRCEEFEGCCTAKIIVDLGGSNTSEFGYHPTDYHKLWRDVVQVVEGRQYYDGIVTAIVTSEQVTAQKVLKDLGFTGTGMAKKNGHREVDIELYYLHIKDWKVPEKPADIVAPQAPVAAPQPFAAARDPAPQPARVERPRDAQGRFVAQEQRGYITRRTGPFNYVERLSHNSVTGACIWGTEQDAATFTRLEYDAIVAARIGHYRQVLTFQPI